MENQEQDRISAFDSLYTTNHIQMMKIMLPYFDAAMRSRKHAMLVTDEGAANAILSMQE